MFKSNNQREAYFAAQKAQGQPKQAKMGSNPQIPNEIGGRAAIPAIKVPQPNFQPIGLTQKFQKIKGILKTPKM
jgi:hypothetical protein